jgi:hypothetical protein
VSTCRSGEEPADRAFIFEDSLRLARFTQRLARMIRASGLALALASLSSALSWDATPFNPASVPLAVRSPYLSTWLPQGGGAALNGAWPTHWAGQVTAWTGYVKVDNATYTFLGTPGNRGSTGAVQKSFSVSPLDNYCRGMYSCQCIVHLHPIGVRTHCRCY